MLCTQLLRLSGDLCPSAGGQGSEAIGASLCALCEGFWSVSSLLPKKKILCTSQTPGSSGLILLCH